MIFLTFYFNDIINLVQHRNAMPISETKPEKVSPRFFRKEQKMWYNDSNSILCPLFRPPKHMLVIILARGPCW